MKKIPINIPPRLILEDALVNKGTAFTAEEREELGLTGLLPYHVSTIEEQVKRRYTNFSEQGSDLAKYSFLNSLQNRNTTLFYRLIMEHINEMVPLIYTPTVGNVSVQYSTLYHEQLGLYLSYPHKDKIEEMIAQYPYTDVDVIVVTDGERILGLGDLGVGGMAIPVGKLALYTIFGGIHPARTLPIILDVGTNNSKLLQDPLYIGWRNQRITGNEYDSFVEAFITAIKKRFPHVLLQWEDFAKPHAHTLLHRYRNTLCSFNDDIQGTAAVVLAAVYSALKLSRSKLKDQRIVVLGGGSAGMGICDQLVKAIIDEGEMDEEEARSIFYIVDLPGLLHDGFEDLDPQQKLYARKKEKLKGWKVRDKNQISLYDVVHNVHPTILIGVSTQMGAFTEEIVKDMAAHVDRPVIFPLSNPTSRCEAHPADLIRWTDGRAIIATGSPFDPIAFNNKIYQIAQCNNVYIFPGVGLGLIAGKATFVSDAVFIKAAKILSNHSPLLDDPYGPLFPTLDRLREVSREIGMAVSHIVFEEGNSRLKKPGSVDEQIWFPNYPTYERKK